MCWAKQTPLAMTEVSQGPMVRLRFKSQLGADLRCVNYCPQAGWYDSCTGSKRASQTTKFAAGSAQTERQWRKVKNARTLDLPDEMTKNYTTRQRTKSKSPAPHPAPFFSYYPPVLGRGDSKYKKKIYHPSSLNPISFAYAHLPLQGEKFCTLGKNENTLVLYCRCFTLWCYCLKATNVCLEHNV